MGGRIDGHLVQGHVDDTAECIEKIDEKNSWIYSFRFSSSFSNYLIDSRAWQIINFFIIIFMTVLSSYVFIEIIDLV